MCVKKMLWVMEWYTNGPELLNHNVHDEESSGQLSVITEDLVQKVAQKWKRTDALQFIERFLKVSLQNCGCCLNDQELCTGWGANMVTEVHQFKHFFSSSSTVCVKITQEIICTVFWDRKSVAGRLSKNSTTVWNPS